MARYSRILAAEMYGEHRPYGYVFGGSGGAYQDDELHREHLDVWDGAVPFVIGTPMSMPNVFSVQAHAMRLLWDKFPRIVDAIEPGGSGDMYAGLTAEQREALAEVDADGLPAAARGSTSSASPAGTPASGRCSPTTSSSEDPSYFEDFWTVPGYLGADPPESLANARVQHKTTIAEVRVRRARPQRSACRCRWRCRRHHDPTTSRSRCGSPRLPDGNLLGATLLVTSGDRRPA